MDPGSGSAIRKKAGSGSVSGSALNQCGSETLNLSVHPYTAVASLVRAVCTAMSAVCTDVVQNR
jgi:hypothetical protein